MCHFDSLLKYHGNVKKDFPVHDLLDMNYVLYCSLTGKLTDIFFVEYVMSYMRGMCTEN